MFKKVINMKKTYINPTMTVVKLTQHSHLLQTSSVNLGDSYDGESIIQAPEFDDFVVDLNDI